MSSVPQPSTPTDLPADPPADLTALPHSGLHVPDATVRVSSLRQLETPHGVAFTAVLRRGRQRVGAISNDGRGGETYFTPDQPRTFGFAEINAFAAACRDGHGEPCSTEQVLNDLVDEYDSGRMVTRDAARGRVTARLLAPLFDDSTRVYATDVCAVRASSTEPPHRAQIARAVFAARPPQPGERWQLWTGARWEDLADPASA